MSNAAGTSEVSGSVEADGVAPAGLLARLELAAPLRVAWSEQLVCLRVPGLAVGVPAALRVNGIPIPFQYTGGGEPESAEVMIRLGFAVREKKVLHWLATSAGTTDLGRTKIDLSAGARLGAPGRELEIPAPFSSVARDGRHRVAGPLTRYAGFEQVSRIHSPKALESASLEQTNHGPLFTDYELIYMFAGGRRYAVRMRSFVQEPWVEISEAFSLGMDAEIIWELNPTRRFSHLLSRDSFERESQPEIEPLGQEHPQGLLCRLQMPVLGEYAVPNNRGWFALCDPADTSKGMLGVLGLYGGKWESPVANMPEVFDAAGAVEWRASLAGGKRFWLLYAGPLETSYTAERRFVFHRLHAQCNALRLDEHLDLDESAVYDAATATAPALFADGDLSAAARARVDAIPALQRAMSDSRAHLDPALRWGELTLRAMLHPTAENLKEVEERLHAQFSKWIRQFQGYRTGQSDYAKSVIGFSRMLRGMLIQYELLRRCGFLDEQAAGRLNACFVFAARHIADEGHWPHSRTALHPDHPESVRDFYTYPGEHKPDRLYWTNSLPNFQSDQLCTLAHIAALFPSHPQSSEWLRTALKDLECQLDAYAGRSGAWEESINYALYTFSYWMITFRVLKNRLGIDYFNDPRVRRVASWLVKFWGPPDKRFGCATWPGVGNARVPQIQAEYLLAYAGELPPDDRLRQQCVAVYQQVADRIELIEHYPAVLAAMAPIPVLRCELDPVSSEWMDEVGVAMRHASRTPLESYLFQKIGYAKDHYEGDETAFNWYAKGTPLCMDYGTYTRDAARPAAHNLVEVPDEDNLRRGFLRQHLFTPAVDYTHCEVPVTLKLLFGHMRSFAEVDGTNASLAREKTPYFYIGDKSPVGSKVWKVRLLLFVKPDYLAIFDRIHGDVPHRYNLHFTGGPAERSGAHISSKGSFDLDLHCMIQHPNEFDVELGRFVPDYNPPGKPEEKHKHAQNYFRIYNRVDGVYRSLLFAKERNRDVRLTPFGRSGIKVVTPEYVDYVFISDEAICQTDAEAGFAGRSGWIRRLADGGIQAMVVDGQWISAFGERFDGLGPWAFNAEGKGEFRLLGGPPRKLRREGR